MRAELVARGLADHKVGPEASEPVAQQAMRERPGLRVAEGVVWCALVLGAILLPDVHLDRRAQPRELRLHRGVQLDHGRGAGKGHIVQVLVREHLDSGRLKVKVGRDIRPQAPISIPHERAPSVDRRAPRGGGAGPRNT